MNSFSKPRGPLWANKESPERTPGVCVWNPARRLSISLRQPRRFLCALPNLVLYVVDGALEPEILKPYLN